MQEQTKRWRDGEDGQRAVTSRPRDVKRLRVHCPFLHARVCERAWGCTRGWGRVGRWGRGGAGRQGRARARAHLDDVGVGAALVRLVVLRVLEQHLVHVGAGVLEQLVGVVEDDERDLAVAQHAQLVRLLHQPELPLGERHLQGGSGRPGGAQSRPAQEPHLQAAGRSPCLGSPHVRVTQLCPQESLVWGRNRPASHGQDTSHSPLAGGRGLRFQWKHLRVPVLGTMTGQGGRTEGLPALPLGSEDGRIRAWKRGVPRSLEACPWLVGRGTGQPGESRVLRAAGRWGFPLHGSLQTRFLQEALSEWLQGTEAEVSTLPHCTAGPRTSSPVGSAHQ